jgi:glycosyltransferase involved in cell wall biosynthesis
MLDLLVVAPTCDGEDVGEAWVAYQWVLGAAERHRTTLLTYYKRGRRPASEQLPGVRVIEWPEPPLFHRAERFNSMFKPGYVPFYYRAKRWIEAARKRGEHFDVAHQPTPVAMRYPSPLARTGIPYVIGPLGGSLDSPPGFPDDDTAPWYVGLRAVDRTRLQRDRTLRRTYSNASCVVGIAPYVRELLTQVPIYRFEVVSDTGIPRLPDVVDRTAHEGPVRLLFVGRVVRTKGARDAIAAMHFLGDDDVVLDIVGEGYDREACEALVAELRLGQRVTMHGRVPRAVVDEFYSKADIFVFPSYREAGGTVVAEAMGYGLPLIVSSRGGPGDAVDDSCGIRIDPIDPEQYARDIATAVRRLVADPPLRKALGDAARSRVTAVRSWPAMHDRMASIYREIADAGRPERS